MFQIIIFNLVIVLKYNCYLALGIFVFLIPIFAYVLH